MYLTKLFVDLLEVLQDDIVEYLLFLLGSKLFILFILAVLLVLSFRHILSQVEIVGVWQVLILEMMLV